MENAGTTPRPAVREAVCVVLAALFSHYLMHYHLAVAVQLPFADLDDLLALRAPRPFCYRWLSPFLLRVAVAAGVESRTAASALEWGSFLLLYYLFRAYLGLFMHHVRAAYAAFSIYFVLPFVFILPQPYTVWFPWDIPSVCFFTALLTLWHKRLWRLWYPVFLLATLNRETTLFLLPLALLTVRSERSQGRLLAHVAATAVTWIAAKGALAYAFRSANGPAWLEWNHYDATTTHWQENLSRWSDPSLWPYLCSALGFLWILAWHLRPATPPGTLRDAWIILPVYVVGVFLFGNMVEHRVYGDLIPVVLAPLLVWSGPEGGSRVGPAAP